MLRILFLFVSIVTCSFMSFSQTNFGSAEERIVYNKQNNLDRYEGVNIEYSFTIVNPSTTTEETITAIADEHFVDLEGIDYYTVNGEHYVSFMTKGNLENHEGATLIRDELYKTLKYSRRTYHLR